jgi:hypothetical protein
MQECFEVLTRGVRGSTDSRLSFLSFDEYEREVGTQQFLLETDPTFKQR